MWCGGGMESETDEASIAGATEQILSDFGTVDVVLNNAGF